MFMTGAALELGDGGGMLLGGGGRMLAGGSMLLGGGGGGMLLGRGGGRPLAACCVNFFGDGMFETFLPSKIDDWCCFENSGSCNIFCKEQSNQILKQLNSVMKHELKKHINGNLRII